MNMKRFIAKTSRDALTLARQAFGDDAVVISTRPSGDGVEVLAMGPDSILHIEQMTAAAPAAAKPAPTAVHRKPAARATPPAPSVQDDVEQLSMSTLSFQDYVRERMLKRRAASMRPPTQAAEPVSPVQTAPVGRSEAAPALRSGQAEFAPRMNDRSSYLSQTQPAIPRDPPVLRDAIRVAQTNTAGPVPTLADAGHRDQNMMDELRSMKGLIEERFGALAFMEKLQRQPAQARLTQHLLEVGFSPALIRKLAASLPADAIDEGVWASGVLERNLITDESEPALEDQGGVFALIGSTGVGKTTTTAKIAAAFATQHGASNLGLITLDAYRVGAHEQLRAYGRILGVPVHTAHDRASLDDLLDLLSAKKMVLIDTAGMAQRDARTRELLDMLSHRSISKLVVVNAASQGETIEDVLLNYRANAAKGVVLSKIDEAIKLGPALDAVIRHKLKVVGVANGQRVPEDWHRLSRQALVQRAMRANPNPSWRLEADDVSLVFAGGPSIAHAGASAHRTGTALHA